MPPISTTKTFTHPISRAYFDKIAAAGGDVSDKNSVDKFVSGLSRIVDPSLWVCWPLRSQHNVGTGSIVYSLGGLGDYSGTLTGGPKWGSSGIITSAANDGINVQAGVFPLPSASFFIVGHNKSANVNMRLYTGVAGSTRGLLHQISTVGDIQMWITSTPYWKLYTNSGFGVGMKKIVGYSIGSPSSAQADIFRDGVLLSTSNDAGSWDTANTSTSLVRQTNTVGTDGYTLPFIITGRTSLTSTQHLAIYNLLKATLCSGLGY